MSCPICQRKTDVEYRPFCSKRCADIDLAKWLGGSYAIPSNDPEDFDKAAEAMEQVIEEAQRKPH
ncbi:DNA gyrase inhibitor YacG [Sagittula salina]|uniref:DNA gyrase inhibitor YacG n=1 Tax=Sagittula salina TaxID=2820268 RepID=A0A940MMM6_9RHOB|nr:DNA gyrase inhibitor YacG [Sagittula salina]